MMSKAKVQGKTLVVACACGHVWVRVFGTVAHAKWAKGWPTPINCPLCQDHNASRKVTGQLVRKRGRPPKLDAEPPAPKNPVAEQPPPESQSGQVGS